MHCEIITTITLVNISVASQSYHFLIRVSTVKIYPLSKFQGSTAVLLTVVTLYSVYGVLCTVVMLLYIRSPELIELA